MEYNELVKALRCDGNNIGQDSGGCTNKKCRYRDPDSACNIVSICEDAATAITDLLVENQSLRNAANGFKARLRELVQADRDGRCVVLPAKIGDSIYFTFLGKIIEKQVFSVVTFYNSQRIYCNGTSLYFGPDDIGETVFLTREAAEEALEGES